MPRLFTKLRVFYRDHHINAWVVFYTLVYVILIIKLITLKELSNNVLFGVYSLAVSFYLLSRFALGYLYKPGPTITDPSYEPTISFAVPTKNEGGVIRETILRIAQSDYPKEKFDIIAVNDGSTDNTLAEMYAARDEARAMGVKVKVVDWARNWGKRMGMAECVLRSKRDIVIFIDSDSFVEPQTAREMVKYFVDPQVGAVAGHGFVANAEKNSLTKMQAVRYYVAFRAYKAAEALFGSVTCCSGCGSAYRREYVMQFLDRWVRQKFLGVTCTYGDDRSLTNFLLAAGYKTLYAPEARVYTFVPETFRQFMRQQLRWKKSWTKESLKAGTFMWKRNPIMSISFYLGVVLPLMSPVVAVRALLWYPFATGNIAWAYIIGVFLMGTCYGLYYYTHTHDRQWFYGVCFAVFYTLVLIWQLPWAILNLRDPKWGTR